MTEKQAFGQAVFWNITDLRQGGGLWVTREDLFASDGNGPLIWLDQTKKRLSNGGASASQESGDTEHFARHEFKIDVGERPLLAERFHFH